MGGILTFARSIFGPLWVRVALPLWVLFSGYDTVSNQFDLPKIPRVVGTTGALFPWWGWLLILQAILIVALFDYVRRNANFPNTTSPAVDEAALRAIVRDAVGLHWETEGRAKIEDSITEKLVVVEQDFFAHIDDRAEITIKQVAVLAEETASLKLETKKRLLANDHALAAIGHREVLLERACKLESGAKSLSLEVRGGSLAEKGAWTEWEAEYKKWRGILEEWLIFATLYRSNAPEIKKIPDNIHKLSWTFGDNNFPIPQRSMSIEHFASSTTIGEK